MNLIDVPVLELLPISLVAALGVPIFTLILATVAGNKVQGFAVMKAGRLLSGALRGLVYLEPWQGLIGVFPTYWPVKAFWVMLDGGNWWAYVGLGLLVNLVWLGVLLRRFNKVVYR
ncbi:MAG: hypothetical protein R2851_04110 [Caldilineaceae bacterium]